MQRLQPGQELALKKCGHRLSRQEEAVLFLVPVPVRVKPAACAEHMDMGMVGQVRPPCVHDADEAGGTFHICRIPGKFRDSFRWHGRTANTVPSGYSRPGRSAQTVGLSAIAAALQPIFFKRNSPLRD